MSKKDNVAMEPKYRFPEFLNCLDWKKEELNKLGKVISGLTYSPQDIREDGLLVLRSSNIKDNVIDLNDTVYVRSDVKGYTLTEENDILICVRNGSKSLIGKNALIPKGMPLCSNGAFMIVFRANNPCFAFQLFQSKQFDKQVKADLGATINSINSKQLKKYIFAIPQVKKEQEKIADCLSSIDDLISAEEKKLSLLNDYKKGWMQKLFPAEGKTVPEWRFPEFKDSKGWEKLNIEKACYPSYSGGTPVTSKKEYYNGDIPFIRSGEIGKEKTELFLTSEGLDNSSAKMIEKGDVLMALYGANSGDVAISPIKGAINQAILCLRHKNNNAFLYHYLAFKKNWIVRTYIQGGQGNLSGEIVKSIELCSPQEPDEQNRIAGFLSVIDELTSNQKEKIEALKQHKKALMQGLFPSIEEVCK